MAAITVTGPPPAWNCHCPDGPVKKPASPVPSKEIPQPPPSDLDFSDIVKEARDAFDTGKTRDLQFREDQLKRLSALYEENTNAMLEAIERDIGRHKLESQMIEVEAMKFEVKRAIKRLKKWAKPTKPKKPSAYCADKLLVQREPYGVVLIIGAWSYPMALSFRPICGAIAGGNCFIVKPSECESSGRFIEEKLKEYLDNACFKVVLGGEREATALLREKFDYIFYTGSQKVAQMVHAASTVYLTPTTLELGGKCPVYVDNTVDMQLATSRILWGKCINAGQSCLAPDYILCTKDVEHEIVTHAKDILYNWYGEKSESSADFCKLRSDKDFSRVTSYLSNGKVAVGGESNHASLYVAPTILVEVSPEDPVMQEEIYGPILPILNVSGEKEAMDFINKREKPLAVYVFTKNKDTVKLFQDMVSCGGICFNDTVVHAGILSMPHGGVGQSGMGVYYGKWTFDTFTHPKGIMIAKYKEKKINKRYPPYNEAKTKAITKMIHS